MSGDCGAGSWELRSRNHPSMCQSKLHQRLGPLRVFFPDFLDDTLSGLSEIARGEGLETLPESLSALTNLKTLNLDGCGALTALPDVSALTQLKDYGPYNEQTRWVEELIAQGPHAIDQGILGL